MDCITCIFLLFPVFSVRLALHGGVALPYLQQLSSVRGYDGGVVATAAVTRKKAHVIRGHADLLLLLVHGHSIPITRWGSCPSVLVGTASSAVLLVRVLAGCLSCFVVRFGRSVLFPFGFPTIFCYCLVAFSSFVNILSLLVVGTVVVVLHGQITFAAFERCTNLFCLAAREPQRRSSL